MLEMLKRLLDYEDPSQCPDFSAIADYLGISTEEATANPDFFRESVAGEIDALEPGGDDDLE